MARIEAPLVLDDLLLYRLTRLMATAGSLVIRQCEGRHGITRREWRLIAILAEQGPVLSSELAARAHLQRSRTSAAVSALQAKGLVLREPRPGNRRQVQVSLTEAGRTVYAEMMPFAVKLNSDLCSILTGPEATLLDELLERIQGRADLLARTVAVPKNERRKGRSRSEPAERPARSRNGS